eukprot:8621703-Prorocentrum_lima.AAC.1
MIPLSSGIICDARIQSPAQPARQFGGEEQVPLETRAVMKKRMTIGALRQDCKSGDGVLMPMSQTE